MTNKLVNYYKIMYSILLLFFILPTFIYALPKPTNITIGISETMGIYGIVNANYDLELENWSDESNHYFIIVGALPIPFLGGAGLGWKHYYNVPRISLFSSASGFGLYLLPAMCSTDNCHAKYDFMINGSVGVDFYAIKTKTINLHLQLGILSQYSLGGNAIDESPSDIPSLWPFINVKLGP